MRHTAAIAILATVAATAPAAAASSGNAGKAVAIALPIAAGGAALLHDWDWDGVGQLAIDTGLTVGTALLLKQIVRERRPDHSNFQSFPSETAAVAFAPAAFLWDRYGWEYGAPAYLAAGYVGYSVVDAKEHHWWDAVASAGIAWTYSRLITTRWRNPRFQSSVYATPDGAFVSVNYRF
jgi:membrane-associated phospholipid phosphatase